MLKFHPKINTNMKLNSKPNNNPKGRGENYRQSSLPPYAISLSPLANDLKLFFCSLFFPDWFWRKDEIYWDKDAPLNQYEFAFILDV
jgi:hypothetical protein